MSLLMIPARKSISNPALSAPYWKCILLIMVFAHIVASNATAGVYEARVDVVMRTPGFVALWDFVKREPDGAKRFSAHVPPGSTNQFPLDAVNYIRDYWGIG